MMTGNQEQKGKCWERDAREPGAAPGPGLDTWPIGKPSFSSQKLVCAPGLPVCVGLT